MLRDWALRIAMGLALTASVGLVACGDDDDDGDNGDGSPAAGGTEQTGNGDQGTVNVLAIWGDEEQASFEAMVDGWGGTMNYTGTRDITPILTTRVEGGNPPDVALPAEIGLFQQFASEGLLTPLSECEGLEQTIRDNYPEAFIELGTVDGTLYGFFMKADTKATVWYDPATFEENALEPLTEESSFDDLVALSEQALDGGLTPWSNGQEAGDGTGFPGSDTIQQIALNEHGEEFYDGIVSGEIPYNDDRMLDTWEKFGQITTPPNYTVQGGGAGIIATAFMQSSYPPFEEPPTAAMVHLGGFAAGFIADQFPDAVPGTDYDFFPFPGGAVTGGANIAYAFNSNPATCSFLDHIASAEAQQVWVERGGFTSLHSGVSLDAYGDDVSRGQAQQLLDAETFKFDMDDAIGGAGQQAIFEGVVAYLTNPDDLTAILDNIASAIEQPEAPAEESTE